MENAENNHRAEEAKAPLLTRLFSAKLLFWVIALSWLAFDLGTKSWAEAELTVAHPFPNSEVTKLYHNFEKYGEEGMVGIQGVMHYKWAENFGAAFSIGADGSVPFTFLSIAVLGIILYYVANTPKKRWFMLMCLALITGGALGNLHDRIFHHTIDTRYVGPNEKIETYGQETTAVRDFLYWPFDIPLYSTVALDPGQEPRKWPIFNIADVGIVAGVIGLVLVQLFVPEQPKRRRKEDDESESAESEGGQGTVPETTGKTTGS